MLIFILNKNLNGNYIKSSKKSKKPHTRIIIATAICAIILIIIIIFAAMFFEFKQFTQQNTPGNNWPSFTFDNSNSRYQSNNTINASNIGQLQEQWYIPTNSGVTSTPVVLNGSVYFADWDGNLYSANVSSGTINWEINLGGAISSTPTLSNGIVYVAFGPSKSTKVFAVSQKNGSIIWNTRLNSTEDAIWGSPTVYNGLVYIGTAGAVFSDGQLSPAYKGQIFALNAQNGTSMWNNTVMVGSSGGAAVWSSAVVDPKLNSIYFGTGNAYNHANNSSYAYSIVSLNATNGKRNWIYQVYNNSYTGQDYDFGDTPNLFQIMLSGKLYSAIGEGGKDGNYYILNRVNGDLLEKYSIGTAGSNGGVIGPAGFIYPKYTFGPEIFIPTYYNNTNGCCGAVEALIPSTNTVSWMDITTGNIRGSVTVIPGAVIFGDLSGRMYAASTTTGNILFNKTFMNRSIEAGITVADGHVFIPVAFPNYQMYNNNNGSTAGLYAFSP
jgi:glucose dehydrogenase